MKPTLLTAALLVSTPAWAFCNSPKLCLDQGYEFKAAASVRLTVSGKQQAVERLYFQRDKELVGCDQITWPDGAPKNADPPGLWYCKVK